MDKVFIEFERTGNMTYNMSFSQSTYSAEVEEVGNILTAKSYA